MIQIVLYQNTNQRIAEAYGKWFPRVANTETIALEDLAEHMSTQEGARTIRDTMKRILFDSSTL